MYPHKPLSCSILEDQEGLARSFFSVKLLQRHVIHMLTQTDVCILRSFLQIHTATLTAFSFFLTDLLFVSQSASPHMWDMCRQNNGRVSCHNRAHGQYCICS